MIEIKNGSILLAILIKREYKNEGIQFFTPDDFSQQLAYMNRPQDYVIKPHVHNPVKREVLFTKEVLIIKSGKVRVDFYSDEKEYYQSIVINSGDILLLANGGHGFEMLEDSEILEVKQGPYAGELDKTRFDPINKAQIKLMDI